MGGLFRTAHSLAQIDILWLGQRLTHVGAKWLCPCNPCQPTSNGIVI